MKNWWEKNNYFPRKGDPSVENSIFFEPFPKAHFKAIYLLDTDIKGGPFKTSSAHISFSLYLGPIASDLQNYGPFPP